MKLQLTLATVLIGGLLIQPSSSAQQTRTISVYKSPSCGCCSKWVDYMRARGFEAKVQDVENIGALKTKLGVRPEYSSCHTTEVGGYVIEGHVPAEAVQRLLKERPKIAGLAVPNMPAGSPGMEMPDGRKDPYAILAFTSDGKTTVYERR
jgi:hypothetical protein